MAKKKTRLGFEDALTGMKKGERVTRKAWGDSTFLFITTYLEFQTATDLSCVQHIRDDLTHDCILAKTRDDKFNPWNASQVDMLASDWIIL